MAQSRQLVADRLLGAGSFCLLIAALAAVDGRVRAFLSTTLPSTSSGDLSMAVARANHAAHSMLSEIGLQASEHMVIVLFGLASLGLLIMMLRA